METASFGRLGAVVDKRALNLLYDDECKSTQWNSLHALEDMK